MSADAGHRAAMLFLPGNADPFEAQQIEPARTLVVDGFPVRL